jgi:hypothetical protein
MTRQSRDRGLPRWVRTAFWLVVSLEWAVVVALVSTPVVAWFTVFRAPPDNPGVARRLTASHIRRVRMGDTEARVRSLLGPPVLTKEETPRPEFPVARSYFYRRRGPWSLILDEGRVYIHFDESKKVIQVYAKSGDDGVYGLGFPPPIEPWEQTLAFVTTFPDPAGGSS